MSEAVLEINAAFPPKLIFPLMESKARYVILYGGRGSGKSWAVARALLIRAVQTPLRVLCCREFMANVSDSVHKLLEEQIELLGLSGRFTIEKAGIYGNNGSEFRFAGIRNNPAGLKSYEGVDVAWVEEAHNVTKSSWSILIPTIRKQHSQIIVNFNAELASDETYQRFIVKTPPNSVVVKINFDENPFLTDILREEAEYMRDNDPDSYLNVWLGNPRVYLENAVYGREIRTATEQNRITTVPYDPLVPVHVFWDLGWRDNTSCIMAQIVGFEFHIIDFLEGSQTTTVEYLAKLQEKNYIYGTHWLPHDAVAKERGTGRSIEEIIRQHGHSVRIVPRLSILDGINAARTMWGRCWFDEKKCADLLQYLRKYVWDMKRLPSGELHSTAKPAPLHSDASHAADAYRYMAIALSAPKDGYREPPPPANVLSGATGWMA